MTKIILIDESDNCGVIISEQQGKLGHVFAVNVTLNPR